MGHRRRSIDDQALLRTRLGRGERLLGTVIASSDLALAELAAAHFDFLWIDLEHSPLTVSDVQGICIACRSGGAGTLVRVRSAGSELITSLLDLGVDGLIAPRIEDAEAATSFAAALRYPPSGSRGFAHRRATSFGLEHGPVLTAERTPLCLVQIESAAAVERAEQIAAVPGVDGLILGPSDLALDLGLEQGLESPELARAIVAVQQAAADAGIISGLAAGGSVEVLRGVLGTSSTLFAYSTDVRMYASAIELAAGKLADGWRDAGEQTAARQASDPKETADG